MGATATLDLLYTKTGGTIMTTTKNSHTKHTKTSTGDVNTLTTWLIVAAFFSFTLFFFGPTYIYFTNSLEFNLSFNEILPWLLGAALIMSAIGGLILYFLTPRWREKGVSLLFVLALLLWIQGNLLVWNYGPLDGRDIWWGKMWLKGVIDASVWVLLLFLAFKKSAWFSRFARTAALAFLAMQVLNVSQAMFRAPKTPSFKRYYIDESSKFHFSTRKNVIVLMMDTFQSDIFQEIITNEPQYKDIFRGFTYFRNTLSSFPKTYTSVPSFLTGQVYDNSIPMEDFLEKAYTSPASLPKLLKEQGFIVELFPMPHTEKTVFFSPAIASNIKKRQSGGGAGQDLGFLMDITLFRFLPHFTKNLVYNNQSWLLKRLWAKPSLPHHASGNPSAHLNDMPVAAKHIKDLPRFSKEAMELGDVQFIQQLVYQSFTAGETPVFKYYHLNGLHRPLVLNEHLEYKMMSTGQRASFATQGKACLQIARLLLETLKGLGQFENSMIVVLADHGCADYAYGVNLSSAGLYEPAGTGTPIPAHIKAAGLPMLLIKPIHEPDHELKISDAPVCLTDLPRTITTALGINKTMLGFPVFAIPQTEARKRYFYYYNWSGWVDGYLYHMRQYVVNGHSWLDSSWQEMAIIQPASAKKPYEWNTPISFGPNGTGPLYQGIGWHEAQKAGFTWTREKRVELFFTLGPGQKDIILLMTLKPFLVPGRLDKQEVSVCVGNRRLKNLILTNPEMAEYQVVIPQNAIVNSRLDIVFEIPTATAPVDLNMGVDVRQLGFALQSLTLKQH